MERVEWSELPINVILIIKGVSKTEDGTVLQLRDAKRLRNYIVVAPEKLCTDICIGDVICREKSNS